MVGENIKVTIITPCFNSEKTIENTIKSVVGQTYKNIEYIIVDGASTDSTIDIVNNYKNTYDNIILVSEKDRGVYDAMNKGIELASGEIIGIINSDDWYELDAVENIVKAYNNEKYVIYYGFTRILRNGVEDKIVLYSHNNLEKQMISHPACFVDTKVYRKYGSFDLKYKSSADYDFMLRMKKENVDFIPVYNLLANFVLGGISSGYIGVLETANLRYTNGIISKKRLIIIKIRVFLHRILKKFRGKD